MRNTQRKSLFLAMTMFLLSPALFADQISLKNGDRLTGTIVKSDAKTLVLKTEAAGDVTFQWSAIDAITSTQPLHVGLAGGQMVVGPVATKDGQIQVTTQTAGVVTAAKDSVQVIRSDSEEAAYDAAMERLQHPHLGDFWSGTLDTASASRGAIRPRFPTISREGRCARRIATKSRFIPVRCMGKTTRLRRVRLLRTKSRAAFAPISISAPDGLRMLRRILTPTRSRIWTFKM